MKSGQKIGSSRRRKRLRPERGTRSPGTLKRPDNKQRPTRAQLTLHASALGMGHHGATNLLAKGDGRMCPAKVTSSQRMHVYLQMQHAQRNMTPKNEGCFRGECRMPMPSSCCAAQLSGPALERLLLRRPSGDMRTWLPT